MSKKKKTVVVKEKWETIEDSKVKNVWQCPDCNTFAEITPDWYQNNGTPMCFQCDIDMEYVHTLIQK